SERPLHGKTIKEIERERIVKALDYTNFNISRAASLLGMSRSTLYRKMRALNLY
ncbi:MAG: sigma-54-dependent Fis family transcriptional regulator, partial [Deltaproteobacteria bacterium]